MLLNWKFESEVDKKLMLGVLTKNVHPLSKEEPNLQDELNIDPSPLQDETPDIPSSINDDQNILFNGSAMNLEESDENQEDELFNR